MFKLNYSQPPAFVVNLCSSCWIFILYTRRIWSDWFYDFNFS